LTNEFKDNLALLWIAGVQDSEIVFRVLGTGEDGMTNTTASMAGSDRSARHAGRIVAVAPGDLRIEATDTTLLFGFKDDIVIRVAAAGSGSRVDVRSLSRVGKSDFGVNANRIRKFLRQLAAG
jgi:hypothetical protein